MLVAALEFDVALVAVLVAAAAEEDAAAVVLAVVLEAEVFVVVDVAGLAGAVTG